MNMSAYCPISWLKTDRLSLREFSLDDRYELVRMHQEPRVRSLLIDDQPLDRHSVAHEFILRMQTLYREYEGLGIWCAERMVTTLDKSELIQPEVQAFFSDSALEKFSQPHSQFIGWFNLMPMPQKQDEIELGSRLLPKVWGAGLALEGGELLLDYAFDTLGRDRVWAVCQMAHRSARYCINALGFEYCGVMQYGDHPAHHYTISERRWRQWQCLSKKRRLRRAVAACGALEEWNDRSPDCGVKTQFIFSNTVE